MLDLARTKNVTIIDYKTYEISFQKINQFLEYVDMQNGKEIFIAKEDMVPFCKNMLPVLEKYFNIVTENFMPEKYLPEEVKFQIYLDAPQNDMRGH